MVTTGTQVDLESRPDSPYIDRDAMLRTVQRGIQFDLFNRPAEAREFLHNRTWQPLLREPERVPPVLQEPEFGSWLLRTALQLAHALLETGQWGSARVYLELIDGWLRRPEALAWPQQAEYQDAGDRWITEQGTGWSTGSEAGPCAERVSLRHDDIWLETQQYLGVVLRDATGETAVDALVAAREALSGSTMRVISPHRRDHYRGVIQHDLVTLRLRRGYPARMVLRELRDAEAMLDEQGNHAMLASASITRATALARLREDRRTAPRHDRLEAAVWAAFEHAASSSENATRVRVDIEGTELLADRRGITAENLERLAAAARLVINHRFAVQAHKLLEHERLRAVVRDLEPQLREVVDERI